MYIYLCDFLYINDATEYSANIPDEKGEKGKVHESKHN